MIRPFALIGLTLLAAPARAEFDPMVIGGAMLCVMPGMMPAIRTTAIEAAGWTRLAPADRADAVALLAGAQSPMLAADMDMALDAAQGMLRQALMAQAQTAPDIGETDEWFLRIDGERSHALRYVEGANGLRCDIATTLVMSRTEVENSLLAVPVGESNMNGATVVRLTDVGGQGTPALVFYPDAAAFQALGIDAPGIFILIGQGAE